MEQLFLEAVQNAPKLNSSPVNEEKGMLYGLYKQATIGDVNTTQPYFFDVVARGKWDAWNSQKSKSTEQVKQEYIDYVNSLIVKYGITNVEIIAEKPNVEIIAENNTLENDIV